MVLILLRPRLRHLIYTEQKKSLKTTNGDRAVSNLKPTPHRIVTKMPPHDKMRNNSEDRTNVLFTKQNKKKTTTNTAN